MKKVYFLFAFTGLLFLCSACITLSPRYIHSPPSHAPAMLKKKGDGKISANIAFAHPNDRKNESILFSPNKTTSSSIGFDINTAYAFSDWFMVTLGGYYKNETDINTTNDILNVWAESKTAYTRKAFDLGAGVLIPFTESRNILFNPIIGINFGKATSNMYNISDTITDNRHFYLNGNMKEFYLSPNFNFQFHKNHKISFSPRFSLLKFDGLKNNYPQKTADLLNLKALDINHFFFSPSVFYQIGFNQIDWLKLDFGVSFSFRLNNDDNFNYLKTRPFQLSSGVSVYF